MDILSVAHTATQVEMCVSRLMDEEIGAEPPVAGAIGRPCKRVSAAMHVGVADKRWQAAICPAVGAVYPLGCASTPTRALNRAME
jgi:hypothetical protein